MISNDVFLQKSEANDRAGSWPKSSSKRRRVTKTVPVSVIAAQVCAAAAGEIGPHIVARLRLPAPVECRHHRARRHQCRLGRPCPATQIISSRLSPGFGAGCASFSAHPRCGCQIEIARSVLRSTGTFYTDRGRPVQPRAKMIEPRIHGNHGSTVHPPMPARRIRLA